MDNTAHAPDTLNRVSVDPREMESFSRMAADWWNPSGKFKPLHDMNAFRVGLIKDILCDHFGLDPDAEKPLNGLRILDIGCGGGLLCEPMTRLGAAVTGVDALEANLKTAQTHAAQMNLDIDYRHGTIEHMTDSGETPFDAVLNMEVIEHVANPPEFMEDCGKMVRSGGLMMCSTINRTFKAFAFAIIGAEYALRWLPRGTHQYEKFIKPVELRRWISDAGLEPEPSIGMSLNVLTNQWKTSDDLSINYVVHALKP